MTNSDDPDCSWKIDTAEIQRDGYPPDMLSRAFLSGVLRSWIKLGPAIKDPKENPIELGKLTKQVSNELDKEHKASNMLIDAIFPVFEQAGAAALKDQALDRSTQALLETMIIRDRTGAYPASIEHIPGKWVDPFNGRALHLKRAGTGIRVYSVGPDLMDDGGIDRSELPPDAPWDKSYDVVASYPPVEGHPRRVSPKPRPNGTVD